MYPGIFLDRDGVLIANREKYVRSWVDVEFLPGVVPAMQALAILNARIVMVTNQSAVGRGIISLNQAIEINERVLSIVREKGGRIDGAYLCPHAPSDGCFCRKPKPGMLIDAARDLQIDLSRSILIGDALTDIGAGKNANVRHTILLLSGRGADQIRLPEAENYRPFFTYKSLLEAVQNYKDWWSEKQYA